MFSNSLLLMMGFCPLLVWGVGRGDSLFFNCVPTNSQSVACRPDLDVSSEGLRTWWVLNTVVFLFPFPYPSRPKSNPTNLEKLSGYLGLKLTIPSLNHRYQTLSPAGTHVQYFLGTCILLTSLTFHRSTRLLLPVTPPHLPPPSLLRMTFKRLPSSKTQINVTSLEKPPLILTTPF